MPIPTLTPVEPWPLRKVQATLDATVRISMNQMSTMVSELNSGVIPGINSAASLVISAAETVTTQAGTTAQNADQVAAFAQAAAADALTAANAASAATASASSASSSAASAQAAADSVSSVNEAASQAIAAATSATQSASQAETSATSAVAAESTVTARATEATTAADNAGISATSAMESATAAATSAAAASTSATSAAQSASAAQAAASAAAAVTGLPAPTAGDSGKAIVVNPAANGWTLVEIGTSADGESYATAAANSATAAALSETNAATSATAAANSAASVAGAVTALTNMPSPTGHDGEVLSVASGAMAWAKRDRAVPLAEGTISAGACNYATGYIFSATISGATTISLTNVPATGTAMLMLRLTNGGSATVTWPSGIKWPGGTAPTLTASGLDEVVLMRTSAGVWSGAVRKDVK